MEDVEILTIKTEPIKLWDEVNEVFIYAPGGELKLKHNLISISKWESKWHKCYMNSHRDITVEQAMDYIRCMTINEVDPDIYYSLTEDDFVSVKEYIENPMSATTISENMLKSSNGGYHGEIVTADLVYYWMIAFNIPHEYEVWHFNRLMTLIKVCSVKSEKPKKMSQHELAARNRALNAQRKAKYNTRG